MALVCLCNGVSERKVRKAMANGASSIDEIGQQCRAGTTCHGCHPTLEELLDEQRAARPVVGRRRAAVA